MEEERLSEFDAVDDFKETNVLSEDKTGLIHIWILFYVTQKTFSTSSQIKSQQGEGEVVRKHHPLTKKIFAFYSYW